MQKMHRVLIIEDESLIGMLLEEILDGLGYAVCGIAETEAEAVLLAEKYQPDVMIVDAVLGDGNGISAVETIEKDRSIPHIFITGDPQQVQWLRPDAITLEKPFFVPQLVAAIARALAMPTAA